MNKKTKSKFQKLIRLFTRFTYTENHKLMVQCIWNFIAKTCTFMICMESSVKLVFQIYLRKIIKFCLD